MLKISEIYDGMYKVCPKCKGHKYIRGQKNTKNNNLEILPNYNHIKQGECFLCDATGEVFFTTDNRVMKVVKTRTGNYCVLEYSSVTGEKIRLVPSDEYLNKNKPVDSGNDSAYYLTEDDLFPNMYEMIWCDWSKIADVIFEEYNNAKAISINRFHEDYNGICINFLFYYDENGNFIKPNFINPEEDSGTIFTSYRGIVLLNKHYIGVSGTYVEGENMLSIGFKTKEAFKYYQIHNINPSKNKNNNDIKVHCGETNNELFNVETIKAISIKVLNDIYKILDEV